MKVCRHNWHSAGSLGWPFPMMKYRYIFQIKYTEAILSNDTRKLLWLETAKMLIAILRSNFVMSFIIFFGTLSLATINQVDPFSRFLRTPTSDRHADTQTHCHNYSHKAKFHYTGPTRPARTRTDFVGDPHGPNGVSRRPGPHKSPCGSGRVRSGPCSGI